VLLLSDFPLIIKPVSVFSTWVYSFGHPHPQLVTSVIPKTPGLRKISSKDIPKARNLVNSYASNFEISQIFKSEEEFLHYFLNPSHRTYVVEDSSSHSITDMFTFNIAGDQFGRSATVTVIV